MFERRNAQRIVYSVAYEVKRKHVALLTDEELTYCVGVKQVIGSKTKMNWLRRKIKGDGVENEAVYSGVGVSCNAIYREF